MIGYLKKMLKVNNVVKYYEYDNFDESTDHNTVTSYYVAGNEGGLLYKIVVIRKYYYNEWALEIEEEDTIEIYLTSLTAKTISVHYIKNRGL